MSEIIVKESLKQLYVALAERLVESSQAAIAARGRFMMALSGGSTPGPFYALLSDPPWRRRLDWQRIHFFWGDERYVPPDSPESNFGMVKKQLLSKVPAPPGNVHPFPTQQGSAEEVAAAYGATLRKVFGVGPEELPQFDFNLLGLGDNGHTASLFPHSPALREKQRWTVAPFVSELNAYRLSLTFPVINASREIVFLVAGKKKAEVVREVLYGNFEPEKLPAQQVKPARGSLLWMLDKDAASLLPEEKIA